jgi:hypothetical protein
MNLWKIFNFKHRLRGVKQEILHMGKLGVCSELSIKLIRADGSVTDYGVVSRRLVTTAGVTYIAQAFTNVTEPENFNYHASGTGTNAESTGDTALQTEVATRVAGTQSNPSAGVYRTVAIIPYTGSLNITEHGILSAASVGTLLDRSVFGAIAVINGDSIQFTYNFTVNAGG